MKSNGYINAENGHVQIGDKLLVTARLTREDFKKSVLYSGQNLSMFFWLKNDYLIEGHKFGVGFVISENHIRQLQLYCGDDAIQTEPQRKDFNDNFAKRIGPKIEYDWGAIKSVENKRDAMALIVINYNE